MRRFHVHVAVQDLESSKAFYSRLFGAEPAVVRHDYANWVIEDPRINLADAAIEDEPGADCCYAHSDKHWTVDPQGIPWESFHTLGAVAHYGDDHGPAAHKAESACGTGGCCAG